MLSENPLVSSQELIIPTGSLSCLFYSERWYENKSRPGTFCFAGTKQENSQEGFVLCNPALCTYPSINKGKNSSTHKYVTAHLRCVVTPDQNLLLCEDETPRKIPFSPSEETLDLCKSKSAPNSAYCVLSCSCFLGTKDNYIKFCPSCRPKPICCKKGCSSLRIHVWALWGFSSQMLNSKQLLKMQASKVHYWILAEVIKWKGIFIKMEILALLKSMTRFLLGWLEAGFLHPYFNGIIAHSPGETINPQGKIIFSLNFAFLSDSCPLQLAENLSIDPSCSLCFYLRK